MHTFKFKIYEGTNGIIRHVKVNRQLDNLRCKTHIQGGFLNVVEGILVVLKTKNIMTNPYMFMADTWQVAWQVADASISKKEKI